MHIEIDSVLKHGSDKLQLNFGQLIEKFKKWIGVSVAPNTLDKSSWNLSVTCSNDLLKTPKDPYRFAIIWSTDKCYLPSCRQCQNEQLTSSSTFCSASTSAESLQT